MQLLMIFFMGFTLWMLLTISFLLHEIGHYMALKRYHVHVDKIQVGMGPVLCCWQKNHTTIMLRLLPSSSSIKYDTARTKRLRKEQQLLIDSAGILMNILLAVMSAYLLHQRFQLPWNALIHPLEIFEVLKMELMRAPSTIQRLIYLTGATLLSVNGMLAIVNSLPIYPCDGEVLLRHLLPHDGLAFFVGVIITGGIVGSYQHWPIETCRWLGVIVSLLFLLMLIQKRHKEKSSY